MSTQAAPGISESIVHNSWFASYIGDASSKAITTKRSAVSRLANKREFALAIDFRGKTYPENLELRISEQRVLWIQREDRLACVRGLAKFLSFPSAKPSVFRPRSTCYTALSYPIKSFSSSADLYCRYRCSGRWSKDGGGCSFSALSLTFHTFNNPVTQHNHVGALAFCRPGHPKPTRTETAIAIAKIIPFAHKKPTKRWVTFIKK